MTFLSSALVLVGCAFGIFFVGVLAVHCTRPKSLRYSLWHTFWTLAVIGARHERLVPLPPPSAGGGISAAHGAIPSRIG